MWDVARTTLETFALLDVVCQIVAAVQACLFDVAFDLENFFPCSVAERRNAGVDDLGGNVSSGSERVSVGQGPFESTQTQDVPGVARLCVERECVQQ